jgi:hypothetical protein
MDLINNPSTSKESLLATLNYHSNSVVCNPFRYVFLLPLIFRMPFDGHIVENIWHLLQMIVIFLYIDKLKQA